MFSVYRNMMEPHWILCDLEVDTGQLISYPVCMIGTKFQQMYPSLRSSGTVGLVWLLSEVSALINQRWLILIATTFYTHQTLKGFQIVPITSLDVINVKVSVKFIAVILTTLIIRVSWTRILAAFWNFRFSVCCKLLKVAPLNSLPPKTFR